MPYNPERNEPAKGMFIEGRIRNFSYRREIFGVVAEVNIVIVAPPEIIEGTICPSDDRVWLRFGAPPEDPLPVLKSAEESSGATLSALLGGIRRRIIPKP